MCIVQHLKHILYTLVPYSERSVKYFSSAGYCYWTLLSVLKQNCGKTKWYRETVPGCRWEPLWNCTVKHHLTWHSRCTWPCDSPRKPLPCRDPHTPAAITSAVDRNQMVTVVTESFRRGKGSHATRQRLGGARLLNLSFFQVHWNRHLNQETNFQVEGFPFLFKVIMQNPGVDCSECDVYIYVYWTVYWLCTIAGTSSASHEAGKSSAMETTSKTGNRVSDEAVSVLVQGIHENWMCWLK